MEGFLALVVAYLVVLKGAGPLIVVHGLWAFSLLSSVVGADPEAWIGTALPIMAQVILVVVVLRRRHRTDLVIAAGPGQE